MCRRGEESVWEYRLSKEEFISFTRASRSTSSSGEREGERERGREGERERVFLLHVPSFFPVPEVTIKTLIRAPSDCVCTWG